LILAAWQVARVLTVHLVLARLSQHRTRTGKVVTRPASTAAGRGLGAYRGAQAAGMA
jgi:hypothetical protein